MTQTWTNGFSTLHHGDARHLPLEDESVHCIVLSPPYWDLRDYGLEDFEGGEPECRHEKPSRGENVARGLFSGHTKEGWERGVCRAC